MSADLADKEAEFIAELEVETGRGLADWMRAITQQALADRNATIDWLRAQHVFFNRSSRAMWLERIHHNGGRPIYEGASGETDSNVPRRPAARTPRPSTAPLYTPGEPSLVPPLAIDAPHAAATAAIEAVLARGKAYRPLAVYLLAEVRKAVPSLVASVHSDMLLLAAPDVFGAIDVRAKDVRIALALGTHPIEAPLERARLASAMPGITHMRVLTDVRTIDDALMELVRKAAAGG